MNPTQQPLDPSIVSLAQSISKTETGGSASPYTQGGASGEYGAYQYTAPTWAADSQKYLGQSVPLNQATPAQQDEVAYNKIKDLGTRGYTPAQIASIWNSGKPDPTGNVGVNKYGVTYDTPAYVSKVESYYNQFSKQNSSGPVNSLTTTTDPTQVGQALTGGKAPAENITALPKELLGAGNALLPAIGDAYNDVTGKNTKTALQQAGDVGSTALTLGTLIPGVDLADLGAIGAKEGLEAAPSLAAKLTRGGLLGGAFGASGALGAGQTDPTQIALSTGEGAIGGAATEGLLSKIIPKSTLGQSIRDTMPLENKATRLDALGKALPENANGGVVRKGFLGTSQIQPSAEDEAVGKAADPYIGGHADPVKKIQNVNQGIKDESITRVGTLDKFAAPANFADMQEYIERNTAPDPSLKKDPTAYENYQRAIKDGLSTLAKVLREDSKETGNYGANISPALITKARISVDQQIERELGKNVLGSPQYTGMKAASVSMRNSLNRLEEDMIRYPGQLEKLNTLNGVVAASRARGIEVDMNSPDVKNQLVSKFVSSTEQTERNAQEAIDSRRNISRLYEARDNLRDRYQKNIGKNRVQEAIQNAGPITGGLINAAKRAIPYGIGDHVL